MPSLLVGGLVAAALAAPGRPALADDALSARFRFERAERLYRQRRFDDALHELFLLQRVTDNPRVSFNVGLCYRELGREQEAFLAFAAYLAALAPGDDDEGQRARAETALAELSARVARVRVVSHPPGATVYVDRTSVGAHGTAPRLLALDEGAHRVILELEGHLPATLPVEAVAGREVTVEATLAPVTGTLAVATETPGARVTVRDADGGAVERADAPVQLALRPGVYDVELAADGHHPRTASLRVRADAVTRWSPPLEPLPVPVGRLTVTSDPPDARLLLDGDLVGFSPTALRDQPAATYTLRLEREGYMPWSTQVELSPDAHVLVAARLVEEGGPRHSTATWILGGAGAAVLLAGVGVGIAALDNRDDYEALREASAGRYATLANDDLAALDDRGERLRLAADVLLAVGGVTLAAAVVLFLVERLREPPASSGSVMPLPGDDGRPSAGSGSR